MLVFRVWGKRVEGLALVSKRLADASSKFQGLEQQPKPTQLP